MENENATPSFMNHAGKHALILGGISVVLTLAAYAIDYTLLASMSFGLISLAVYLGYGIYSGINYRNEIGGYLSFGKAFQHGFVVFAVSALISTIFNILLYTVIDPELPEKITEVAVENAQKMMEGFGMSGDQLDEAMQKTKEDTIKRYTAGGLAMSYGFTLIGCAIFALISGAIAKRKEPETL